MAFRLFISLSMVCIAFISAAQLSSGAEPPQNSAPCIEQEPAPEPQNAASEQIATACDTAGLPPVLDLQTAMTVALRDNPSLMAAALRIEQARSEIEQARAAFFPTVEASASVAHVWLDENTYRTRRNNAFPGSLLNTRASAGAGPFPVLAVLGDYTDALASAIATRKGIDDGSSTYSMTLTAQWILFDGLDREFTYIASRHGASATEAALLDAQRLLLAAVISAYHAAALAREDQSIAKADEAFNLRQFEEAKILRDRGKGSLSDVLNFEVRVNAARSSVISSDTSYHTALTTLARLIALPGGRFPDGVDIEPLVDEQADDLILPDEELLVAEAMEMRPDILQSQHTADRAEALRRASMGAFMPSVRVGATRTASETERHVGRDDLNTTLNLSFSYTLFAGGRNRAQYREARAARDEARHNLAYARLTASSEVRKSMDKLEGAQKQLWLQRANAVLVEKNRDLVEKEYRAGSTSLVRLNEAQRDLVSAQGQLALARISLRQAWYDLWTATGAILERVPEER